MKPFADDSRSPAVRGFWHEPAGQQAGVLVLTHGGGSNASSPLLVAVAEAFVEVGFAVLRCDLPFRQARPHGPPFPATAAQDRAGILNAVLSVRDRGWGGRLGVGGRSEWGPRASMCARGKADTCGPLSRL